MGSRPSRSACRPSKTFRASPGTLCILLWIISRYLVPYAQYHVYIGLLSKCLYSIFSKSRLWTRFSRDRILVILNTWRICVCKLSAEPPPALLRDKRYILHFVSTCASLQKSWSGPPTLPPSLSDASITEWFSYIWETHSAPPHVLQTENTCILSCSLMNAYV